ncbi:hypothetical protein H4R33_000028 [Dimargaris cristalligena]|nr:hypothetical protein H4R33_000028 [Dimargaris cristalligena]
MLHGVLPSIQPAGGAIPTIQGLSGLYVQSLSPLKRLKLRRFFQRVSFKLSQSPTAVPEYNAKTDPTGAVSRAAVSRIASLASPLTPDTTQPPELREKGGEMRFPPHLRYEEYELSEFLANFLDQAARSNGGNQDGVRADSSSKVGLKAYQGLNPEGQGEAEGIRNLRAKSAAFRELHGRGKLNSENVQHLTETTNAFLAELDKPVPVEVGVSK